MVEMFKIIGRGIGEREKLRRGINKLQIIDIDTTICKICKVEVEDLTYFMLRCIGLERRRMEIVRELEGRCERETLGKMLFKGEKVVEVGDMLYEMWNERRSKIVLEELKEQNELRQNRREGDTVKNIYFRPY